MIFVEIGSPFPEIEKTNELIWRWRFPFARTPVTALNSTKALELGKSCDTQDSPPNSHRQDTQRRLMAGYRPFETASLSHFDL